MDSFLLHKIASHLDFYQVWKLRELSPWCKKEIEKEQQRYVEKIRVELRSEEDDWLLFPAATLVFKCVSFNAENHIFKFELESNNNQAPDGCTLPVFLKYWEKYCHNSVSLIVNSKPTRSYYTIAKQNSPTRSQKHVWYKTDSIYYGLRTRLADYDFYVDFHRPLEVWKQLIANGVVRTADTQSKLSLMDSDVQRILKERKLMELPVGEGEIYVQATSSFLFPQLSNRVCVFPDKLQKLQENYAIIKDEPFEVKGMNVVNWMAKNSTVSCSAI